ncbi:hypothetical protein FLBR109950_10210 [Flavobacterium branchiophilum]|uniref:Uncharacterized protein n=1 Tax=Flavobacterium branchiophilum (strain FL-15) TaxID=1034807 RepID=G2Z719_FLABF|nr:hypothetical protein [Flavobacterium branchiophilum]CCB68646.1 Hypothetical protein FBFL15_0532 [Flavobacterium branchiophilum FL-15]
MIQFIKKNKIPIALGLLVYGFYLYNTITGKRICDCEKTEKYNDATNRSHGARNHFYHK